MDFRKTMTLSFWVKINSSEINQTLIHNGGLGGSDASISIEVFTITEANTPKMYITGGVRVCDRTEDIMIPITNLNLFKTWTFIALTACVSQAEGRDEIPVVTLYVNDDEDSAEEQADSRKCFEQLFVKLTKLKSRFEDEDPKQDDPDREGEYRYSVLDRRLDEAEELMRNTRFKRDVFRENGDPEPTIRLSKNPMIIGEGLDGNIDEIVVCNLCADKDQIDALRLNGEIPRRFGKADI
ncbi:unnamed protein product [Owenia fusiformis]|uniref:Uncharacterized protein n=1 Tax=Owenia fusiformis TaxID=6347 RepID=A0A8J1UL74_OWEFU|nr:unnamed protein product [Owenia fusiformis]